MPLPAEFLRVAFLRPTPLQRAAIKLWHAVKFVVPVVIVVGLVGHDLVIASAYNLAGCRIKGNVSHNGGKKIFHAPGQQSYYETQIALFRGELWFCSEAAAREAGWRKAGK